MRSKLYLAAAGAWLLFEGLPGLARSPEPSTKTKLAVWVISFEGDVTVQSRDGGNWTPVRAQSWLESGDKIRIRIGISSWVKIVDGGGSRNEYRHEEPGHREITIESPAEAETSFVSRAWAAFRSLSAEPTPEAPGASMSPGEEDPPALLHPRAGRVLSVTPEVAWLAPSADASTFQVCLKRDIGKKPTSACDDPERVWEVDGTGAEVGAGPGSESPLVFTLPYPEQPPLAEGETYRFAVRRRSETRYTNWGTLRVAAGDSPRIEKEREEVENVYPATAGDVTAHLVHAASLIDQELYTAALLVLWEAREQQPESPAVGHLLAWLYQQVGPPFLIADLEAKPE
jgi:hypothetical protein